MTTTAYTLQDVPLGQSESELARAIGKSVGFVSARRRDGTITPLCRLKSGAIIYHFPTALAVLETANPTQTEK